MALDMAKYRNLFLEEATEHLGEISVALLELEKDRASVESIDLIFRMAHSIKSMAASLGFDSVTEVAHHLEDRMQEIRAAGSVSSPEELSLLFRGLEGLEAMVAVVRESGEPPQAHPDLVEALSRPVRSSAAAKKKALSPR
ncbi:MAG: Hpt domain-containing protein [Proteobacteria bacterium]|nr:Hpt domain-containing protein [Pseudomonadota bacterium]MCZ6784674.1 Hpt domain-containing protein [Pseudomonadota bacterium]